jgi:peptide/nickel transport system permease protein
MPWLVLLIFRFDLIWDTIFLLFNFVGLIFTDTSKAINVIDYRTLDYFLGTVLVFLIPLLILYFNSKNKFLKVDLNFTNSALTLLVFILLFAPIITNEHPDFYKNIRLTKLLPPLSKVSYLSLKSNISQDNSVVENHLNKKNKIIKREFDETIMLCDSIDVESSSVIVHQKNTFKIIDKSELILEDSLPLVASKFYLFGTDEFGRDIFTRIVYGTRISVLIGIGAVFLSMIIGIILGSLSGFTGGIFDRIFSRITDLFLAFPMIILVILVIGLFGSSLWSIIIVLGLSGWMSLFKIVKSELVSLKNKDYFLAAQMIGLNKSQLLIKEVIPIIAAPVIVNIVFQFGNVILAESALSYLGLGIGNDFPSWGAMIQSGQSYISRAWWMIFFPGTILVGTLLTAKNIGDKLNKVLNPKLK